MLSSKDRDVSERVEKLELLKEWISNSASEAELRAHMPAMLDSLAVQLTDNKPRVIGASCFTVTTLVQVNALCTPALV